jgi:hypothetical protein
VDVGGRRSLLDKDYKPKKYKKDEHEHEHKKEDKYYPKKDKKYNLKAKVLQHVSTPSSC